MRFQHAVLALSLVVALVYAPSIGYSFVSHDDHEYAYENDMVRRGLSASGIRWAFRSCGYASNWHPLTWISLQADAEICRRLYGSFRDDDLAHTMHFHNVVIHALNAALLLTLMMLMSSAAGGARDRGDQCLVAALLCALWAIHPLRTEVVCWVSERKEVSSVFWMLLSMVLWVLPRSLRTFLPSFACHALALCCKPVAVTLPVALFAWDWIMLRRPFRRTFLSTLAFGILSLGCIVLTFKAQTDPLEAGRQFTVLKQAVMAVSAPIVYLRQTVCPCGLSAIYPIPTILGIACEAVLGVILIGAMALAAFHWLKHRKTWSSICTFGICWAYVALIPMLGIVKVGDQHHSDRYTYWAGCAVAAVCWLLMRKCVRIRDAVMLKVLAGLLVISTVLTLSRMRVWRDSLAFYADCVPKSWHPDAICVYSNVLRRKGPEGARQAEELLREALAHTRNPDVRAEFAHVLAFGARKSDIVLDPNSPDPAFAEALLDAEEVLESDPGNSRAHQAIAFIRLKEGKTDEALSHLETALKTAKKNDVNWIRKMIEDCRRKLAEGVDVQR